MVFTSSAQLGAAYARIKSSAAAQPNANTVLVIASPDPDALCACKMISNLLKSDCITHQIIPVSGYDVLDRTNDLKIKNNDSLRSIIMLNCGGVIDIAATLSIPPEATVYIIDSHRPLHLGSIYKYEQVMVLDDGEIEEMKDVEEAFNAIEMADSEDDDDDEDDDGGLDLESDAESEREARPKTRISRQDDEEEVEEESQIIDNFDDDGENLDGEGSDLSGGRKRKKPTGSGQSTDDEGGAEENASPSRSRHRPALDPTVAKRRKSMEKRRKRNRYLDTLAQYYEEGSYYGMSASQLVYMMLTQIGKVTGDALWMSIIALTDQYLHERIGLGTYKASALSFKEDTTKFDLSGGAAGGAGEENDNNPLDGDDDDDDEEFGAMPRLPAALNINGVGAGGQNRAARQRFAAAGMGQYGSKGADDRSIKCVEEFRLMLMRHWSFYDCMFYSQYVAAQLGTWKEKGRQKLTNLMARMGLPQTQTHQPFTEMKISFQKEVRTKLLALGPTFSMSQLQFPSFVRHNGYKITVSASDSVHALLALLDCGASWMRRHAVGGVVDEAVSDVKVGDSSGTVAHAGASSIAAKISAAASAKLTGTGMGTRLGAGAVSVKISEFDDVIGASVEGYEQPVPGEDEVEKAEREARNRRREREGEWVKNFYMAYDALDNIDLIFHGIQLSMQFQRILVKTGISIIEKNMTKTMKTFRFTVVNQSGGGNAHGGQRAPGGLAGESDSSVFGRSVALLNRLAVFLMEAYREHKKKQLPLVIAAYNDETESYLVIGVPVLKRGEKKNRFGMAFLKAAQRTNVAFRSDAFDNSVAEIQKEDLLDFVEALQTLV
ncbi:CDC45-like protein [Rhizoclosmatium globosum]|uniref:CDC45-like protein n=1 Tax=Rhizoclosmatium globosum TaxID=329046 RepID=A0A1Y2BZM0_9FUNG|nr:CDC45-like protein [Rhizoclosmatium globosum]|eukprot:ORY40218.1 CDC45-like protein [Rhizoclosmatium globosum]